MEHISNWIHLARWRIVPCLSKGWWLLQLILILESSLKARKQDLEHGSQVLGFTPSYSGFHAQLRELRGFQKSSWKLRFFRCFPSKSTPRVGNFHSPFLQNVNKHCMRSHVICPMYIINLGYFDDFEGLDYTSILRHTPTRWLSLAVYREITEILGPNMCLLPWSQWCRQGEINKKDSQWSIHHAKTSLSDWCVIPDQRLQPTTSGL